MKILVTGHNGYIGSVMVHVLQSIGHEIVGLDTDFFKECTFGDAKTSIAEIKKDIRDLSPQDLQGFDAVIHLAALSNDPLGEINPKLTFDINHIGSVLLAKLSKDAGVRRFLYSSSCSIYGSSGSLLVTEEAPLAPLTPYAISKVKTEEDLRKLACEDFSPVYMRNATAYGVSPRLRADLVLNNLVLWAHTTGRIRIMSDGTPWRPIIHVQDLTSAFIAVLDAPVNVIHNQAFNVGIDTENYQVRDLAEFVRESVPGCRIEYAEGGGPDPRSYRVDFGKICRQLPGFQPIWSARMGARELYEAVQREGLTLADFHGRKYVRLTQIKHLVSKGLIDGNFRWRN